MKTYQKIITYVISLGFITLCLTTNSVNGVEPFQEDQDIEGQPCAQYNLGMRLLNSSDTSPNFIRAAALLSKAAYANEARAQYALGSLYLRGWGVPRDTALAYAWIALSVEPGDERAKRALEGLRKQLPSPTLRLAEEKKREISAKLPPSRVHCLPPSRKGTTYGK